MPLLQSFPKSLLGVMVLAAGVELAKVAQSVTETGDSLEVGGVDNEDERFDHKLRHEQEGRDRWMVMLTTVAGCLAFKNDAVGFLAGMIWHWSQRLPTWLSFRRRGSIKLVHDNRQEESADLLSVSHGSSSQ